MLFNFKLKYLVSCPGKSETQDEGYFVERSSIIAQWFSKYEGRDKWNHHVGLYEKWWALVESWMEISSVAEGTKWMCVGN